MKSSKPDEVEISPDVPSLVQKAQKRLYIEEEPLKEQPRKTTRLNEVTISSDLPSPAPQAQKRLRSEEESLKEQSMKISRLNDGEPKPRTAHSTVEGSSKMGIRNTAPMTDEQLRLVHQALTLAISKEAKGKGPKFGGFTHKPGWILVICNDKETEKWLVDEIKRTKPWPEAELAVIPESELPRPRVGTVFLPDSEAASIEQALKMLSAQNKGLNTEFWKVLNKRAKKGGSVLTFSLDGPSVQALRASEGRAVFGFKTVTFKIKNSACQSGTPKPTLPKPSTSGRKTSSEVFRRLPYRGNHRGAIRGVFAGRARILPTQAKTTYPFLRKVDP